MAITKNAEPILRVYKGSTEVFQNDGLWEQLELGPEYTGIVLAQPNYETKTVKLAGHMMTNSSSAGSKFVLHPDGWKFNLTTAQWYGILFSSTGSAAALFGDTYSSDANGDLIHEKMGSHSITIFGKSAMTTGAQTAANFVSDMEPVEIPITF